MKNLLRRIFFAGFAMAALIAPSLVSAALFTGAQMEEIKCAEEKSQLFYYYLAPERNPLTANYTLKCKGLNSQIKMPQWLDQALPSMIARKVWRDPAEGELSEAAIWQTPVAQLYEFSNLTRKTFPASEKGAGIPPGLLVQEYAGIKAHYATAVNRLYRAREAKLADSMQGRGRALLAIFELILREMESVSDAISSNDPQRFAVAATAVAVLSQDAFGQLLRSPRQTAKEPPANPLGKVVPLILKLAGILLIFFAVKRFLGREEEGMKKLVQDYVKKTKQWTEDFNRQFLQVKVQHMVMIPAGLFALAGLLTFSFMGFIILTGIGLYIGLHMPGFMLNFLKQRRGKQVDAQLMDALILLSNSLKSGMDIVQGFGLVHHDLTPPISEEFGLVIKNYQLGTPFERALEGMEERVASRLLSYMVKAIILQRQVGGNLTKIFERIVENIREEGKLEEKTKALTAQQKIQSIVVGIMPWIMLLVMFVFQGEKMTQFYFSPLGLVILIFCGVWIGIGMKVVGKLGEIKV